LESFIFTLSLMILNISAFSVIYITGVLNMLVIKLKPLLASLGITLGAGAAAALISSGSTDIYADIAKPALAPPAIVFPIVWTILYLLMGISLYMIQTSGSPKRDRALKAFGAQLLLNFIWPLVFFNMRQFAIALMILILLWLTAAYMIYLFYKIKPAAAYLQIPYFLWLTFAAYLNLAVVLLNK